MAAGTSIEIKGIEECIAAFKSLEIDMRRSANSELRQASKAIGQGIIPMLGGSGSPQEAKILAAAGIKSDRYIVVGVPNRKPALSGLKKTPARWPSGSGSRWKVALAGSSSTGRRSAPW